MPRSLPVQAADDRVAEFAQELNSLRDSAGLSIRALAHGMPYGKSTIADALSGRRLASWQLVEGIVRQCGGDPEEWREKWLSLRGAEPVETPTERVPAPTGQWRASSFLGQLDEASRDRLLQAGLPRLYKPGETLFLEGDATRSVAIVLSGFVKATVFAPSGRTLLLALRGPGDIVGEASALDGQPQPATVTSVEQTFVRWFSQEEFLRCVQSSPAIAAGLTRDIVSRLREASSQRIDLDAPALKRVARVLLHLAREFGEAGSDGHTISLPISQGELATLADTSAPTAIRALHTLRERGLVSTGYRSIRIFDMDRLREAAQF
ncbi:cyclic nucleotide-binding domain-containing protein [Actinospica durhamensis]|uniref:Cyclic nucleotide-binding domain-containing protein n=1 Tax=Actinospica durhamensis TaxID=1508375 RepID=A0A941EMI6_9ACTN|nr:cyclic nucleotide-binding domain-containing protein [Actinospica durhamensis]MBR7834422.1 cyclic nucleotide-binding domain-containing protein [Actinospica durhamensis]